MNSSYGQSELNFIHFSEHSPKELGPIIGKLGNNTVVNRFSIRLWDTDAINSNYAHTFFLLTEDGARKLSGNQFSSSDYLFLDGVEVDELFEALISLPNLSTISFRDVIFEQPTDNWFGLLEQLAEKCGTGLSFTNCSIDTRVLNSLGVTHTKSKLDFCSIKSNI